MLTTQYLEEADRIVVLDHGRVAGRGTSHELKWLVGGRVVTTAVAVGHLDRLDDRADLVRPAGPGSVIATFGVDGVDAAAALVARFNHSRAHSAALAIAGRHAR